MKILLYTEGEKLISKSGLGKAINHQKEALKEVGIEYTTNPKDDYDIIHLNMYGLKSIRRAKNARRKGKKVVYHAHSTEEDVRNSFLFSNTFAPLFRDWIVYCYKLGDYIITPTPYSKRLVSGYGITKSIDAISNGINLKFFKPTKTTGEFRKKYGYKKTDKIVIAIGLQLERKGIVDFVELARRLPEYKFIWFGQSYKAVTPGVVAKAVNTKLSNLKFPGYVEPSEIKEAFAEAALYLYPTLEETEGIPIIEACAMKCDALIRDIPVFDEWLEDGVNVYKAKDLDEFEEKIKLIVEKKVPSLVDNGYKVAEERDLKRVGQQLKRVYETVLNSD